MKATKRVEQESSFTVDAITSSDEAVVTMQGFNISPRGIAVNCTPEQIAVLHGLDAEGCQSKYQELLVVLRLNFRSGEVVELETTSQIQSIRRVSQSEFEVNMAFSAMVQDGYRHISRYMEDLSSIETE